MPDAPTPAAIMDGALLLAFDFAAYLPYTVGCGVAVAVAVAVWATAGRRRPSGPPEAPDRGAGWEGKEDAFGDRRGSVRRDGAAVRVFATSETLGGDVQSGWVVDRSTGGLRLILDAPVAQGSSLRVRTENAPDTTPWVTVLVRSCKDTGGHFELGCAFEQTPPWNVLLLFG